MIDKLKGLFKDKPKELVILSTDGDTYLLIHKKTEKVVGDRDSLGGTVNNLNVELHKLKELDETINPLDIINNRTWEDYGFSIVRRVSLHKLKFNVLD